jgi:signal transduction histidine kinase
MERGTDDPEALEQLFRLDHLTTRMRRHAEGLIVLSGASPGRRWREPVPLVEVLRGATGETEDYARVDLDAHTQDRVAGGAVADVTHLLAELIENAANYSPPGTQVRVVAYRAASGLVIEIEDRGIGIPQDTLAVLNHRLANPPEFDLVDADQLGLFVVSRLADRQQIRVSLRVSSYGGTAATVLLPYQIVVQGDDPAARPGAESSPGGVLRSPGSRPARTAAAGRTGDARSPDQARALISSIRQGWRNGSAADPNPDSDTDGAQA